MTVVDVTDPTAPRVAMSSSNDMGSLYSVGYHNGFVYAVAAWTDMIVSVNVSTPASPTHWDSLGGASICIDNPVSLVVDQTTAYLTSNAVDAVVTVGASAPAKGMRVLGSTTGADLTDPTGIAAPRRKGIVKGELLCRVILVLVSHSFRLAGFGRKKRKSQALRCQSFWRHQVDSNYIYVVAENRLVIMEKKRPQHLLR